MIICYDIPLKDKCLSHQLYPMIKKVLERREKKRYTFWGLGNNNIKEIEEVRKKK